MVNDGKWWLIICLVVFRQPSEKYMSSPIGIMKFPTEWKVIKVMFQTTNQILDIDFHNVVPTIHHPQVTIFAAWIPTYHITCL